MKLTTRHLSAAGAALSMLALPTWASDCDVLRQVMTHAKSDFKGIKGAVTDDDADGKWYASSLKLQAFPDCEIMESEGRFSFSCSNGGGRSRVEMPLDTAERVFHSCNFRVRDSEDFSRGSRTSKVYRVITEDRQLVEVTTYSFSGRRSSVRLSVTKP